MSERPVLELLAGHAAPAGFEDLAADLARLSEPVAGPVTATAVVATLAASPTAPGLEAALASGRPVAIWSDDGAVDRRAACRITSVPPRGGDSSAITLSPHRLDLDRHPACMPFVRARARRARGLPDVLVVDTGRLDGEAEVHAALHYASVAIASLPWAPVALARGVPLVTDDTTVTDLGVEPGVAAAVATAQGERDVLAAEIALDGHRAAALARAGRQFAERALDGRRSGTLVARALGLSTRSVEHPRRVIADRLRELRSAP